jgi:hypothetical protein
VTGVQTVLFHLSSSSRDYTSTTYLEDPKLGIL